MHDDPQHFSGERSWEALIHQEGLTPDDAQAFKRYCFENNIDPALSSLDMLEAMYREWRNNSETTESTEG